MSLEASALIGAWTLSGFRVTFSDGRDALEPFGGDARGLLVYSADGHVCAVLSRGDRQPLQAGSLEQAHRASEADKARAFDSYLSYAGRWRLEGDEVTHLVELAAVPEVVGAEQKRRATLDGDALTLRYDVATRSGASAHYELRWLRAQATGASDA
jgi:hypothetical protein